MLSLEEAVDRILAVIRPGAAESVPLAAAAGRYLAAPIASSLALPPFDNSAMDGYAVRAADLAAARAGGAVRLHLAGQSPAGADPRFTLQPGTCARVFTGSVLPPGADAVVMQEEVHIDPTQPDEVGFQEPCRPWENIRLRGEDVKPGQGIALAGTCVSAGLIGLLGAVGVGEVQVHRRPRLAILATGDELTEPGQPLAPGRIYESNRAALAALAADCGALPEVFPIVQDAPEPTRAALAAAFEQCDAVLTSGGVSVGERDYVKSAFAELGGETSFWRVAIKPGKPFVFGRWQGKCLFGVPGNPVSALVTALLLVRPALLRWQGALHCQPRTAPGRLAETLTNRGDRRHFVRVTLDPAGEVRSAGTQASHMLHSLARANGLVEVPAESTLPCGEIVPVLLFGF